MAWLTSKLSGWVWNPILVKELRASTRGARFFWVHLAILILFSAILLLTLASAMAVSYSGVVTPDKIGEGAFLVSQIVHLCTAFLIVPAFAATAISSERDRGTYDILMSTTLTPWQIAWGKLTAALTEISIIFISLSPLVAITFLFGGVTIHQVLANYAFLFAVCAVLSAWALSVSSSVRSTTRGVIGVYAGSIIAGIGLGCVAGLMEEAGVLHHYLAAYGFTSSETSGPYRAWRAVHLGTAQKALYVYAAPITAAGIGFTLFLLNAATRLKPFFADKARPFRWFYLAAGAIVLGFLYAAFRLDVAGGGMKDHLVMGAIATASLVILGSISCLFACEPPILPRPLREHYVALPARRRWLAWFAPGATAGARFSFLATLLLAVVAFLLFAPWQEGVGSHRGAHPWLGRPDWLPLAVGLSVAVTWVYMLSGLGLALATFIKDRPMLVRTLLVSAGILLILAPIIHWAIVTAMSESWRDNEPPAPFSLCFSPVATLLATFNVDPRTYEIPVFVRVAGRGLPLGFPNVVLMAVLGTVFRLAAAPRLRRLEQEPE